MILQELHEKNLLQGMPSFLLTNTHYVAIIGSHAYGVADTSVKTKIPDYDIYGWAIPPKEFVFPHLGGHILGFGPKPPTFDQWQQHQVFDRDALAGNGKEYDFQIFGIVKYLDLLRQNNPNIIDTLFVPENCILHCTQVGRMIRDKRHLFLSKECWVKFRGYAASQLKKMNDKEPIGGRREIVDKHGYDVKFAYHLIRLYDEAEQIILQGDLDLQRARETMKSVRRGEWTEQQVRDWVVAKETSLEKSFAECKLPDKPPFEPIKQLLLNCLEQHYGSLKNSIEQVGWAESTLKKLDSVLDEVRAKLYN